MLLTFDCLSYKIVGDKLLPNWLGAADEPFVMQLLEDVRALDGLAISEVELAATSLLERTARTARVPTKLAEALWSIERRRWDPRIDAAVNPEALRDVVFELAMRMSKEEAIAEAAAHFKLMPGLVLGSLFADRPGRRRLLAPRQRTRPEDLFARYNLALAQSLLSRSMEVQASVVGDPSVIIAAAKRDGLLARFEAGEGETTRLSLVGPLALLRNTAKYGRSLARFIPALIALPQWSLRARIALGARSGELELDHSGSVSFAATMPAAPDGRLARRVARSLRDVGIRVDLHPEIVRLSESTVVVPDFALILDRHRIPVDVIPFATPEYLSAKIDAIRPMETPMILCVDERFAVSDRAYPWLLTYRDEIDGDSLYKVALRIVSDLLSSSSPSLPSSSSSSSSQKPSTSSSFSEPPPRRRSTRGKRSPAQG